MNNQTILIKNDDVALVIGKNGEIDMFLPKPEESSFETKYRSLLISALGFAISKSDHRIEEIIKDFTETLEGNSHE